jgi:hypothetical protein
VKTLVAAAEPPERGVGVVTYGPAVTFTAASTHVVTPVLPFATMASTASAARGWVVRTR